MSTRETPFKPMESLKEDSAFQFGHTLFAEEFYWEAHEIWESVWMACAPNSPQKLLVQAMIQVANARLKQCMDRPKAADRLYCEADRLARDAFQRAGGEIEGMTCDWFDKWVNNVI